MSKLILTLPKDPDRAYFEPNYAVIDRVSRDEEKVVAIFDKLCLAERFKNDMNGRSDCNYYTRFIERAL